MHICIYREYIYVNVQSIVPMQCEITKKQKSLKRVSCWEESKPGVLACIWLFVAILLWKDGTGKHATKEHSTIQIHIYYICI